MYKNICTKSLNYTQKFLLFFISFSFIFMVIPIYAEENKHETQIDIENYDSSKPILIVVDVVDSIMNVFQDGKIIKTYTIAGGAPKSPSPIGTWTIISKGTWGEGFGGRWMGFNVPWGKFGIHGTIYPNSIGWNSSHGCIRMWNKDVAELYKITKHGTKVIIWAGPFGNFGSYLRKLKPGMTGADIYELQTILREKGYYKANPDGIYGDYFKQVVHKFKKDNNLPINDYVDWTFYEKLGVELID